MRKCKREGCEACFEGGPPNKSYCSKRCYHRDYNSDYEKRPQRIAYCRVWHLAYMRSPKGKASQAAYRPRHKDNAKRYRTTPQGRIASSETQKRYRCRKHEFALLLKIAWQLEHFSQELERTMQATVERQTTNELRGIVDRMELLSTESLKQQFAEGIRLTRTQLLTLAATLFVLESRGEEVGGDRNLLNMLRKIGSGELLVDVVVRFAGRPYTMASVGRLPIERQVELLNKDDREVDATFERPRVRQRSGTPPVSIARREREQQEIEQASLAPLERMAAVASVGDLAESLFEIVSKNENPVAVVERLLSMV